MRTRDGDRAHHYRNAMFVIFLGLAVFGLVHSATTNGKLYWVRPIMERATPFGPYVNPTHFAGVMELAVPWLLGYAIVKLREGRRGELSAATTPIFAAGALICLAAGLATASKAAALFMGAGLTFMGLLAMRTVRTKLIMAGTLVVVWGGTAAVLSFTALGERFREFLDAAGGSLSEVRRLVAWRPALDMLGDYIGTGTGFGAFRDVFPYYMPSGEVVRWSRLHNDYLEVAIEGGVVAVLLLAWLMWSYGSRAVRAACRRGPGALDFERVGMAVGLVTLALHATIEFNHQMPANALLFVSVAGMLLSHGADRREPVS